MNIVNNEKQLLKAINEDVSEIVLEGEWKNNIAEIFTKDSVSWLVAVSSITSIVTISVAQGISELLELSVAAPLIAIFGTVVAAYLIGLAISEGIDSIRKLRESYILSESNKERAVLKIKA